MGFREREPGAASSLDLLVIEEAGQFCLANTIAVAPAARNLLLLGDPQQLPQVSQGHHPEPVDASALGWLVDGRHPCPTSSAASWTAPIGCIRRCARRCRGCPTTGGYTRCPRRRRHGGSTVSSPACTCWSLDHDGNSTESPEEAVAIVAAITGLLGAAWTDEHGTRPLNASDVLVVTPYNAQVVLLRQLLDQAGLHGVQAGTVDKFQGRQAPVVFVSMVASSIDDVPRESRSCSTAIGSTSR